MSDSDNNNFFGEFPHDDVVREALEEEPFGPSGTCCAGQVCERNDFIFEKVNGSVDRVIEFLATPGRSCSYQAASIASTAACSRIRTRRTSGYRAVLAFGAGIRLDR